MTSLESQVLVTGSKNGIEVFDAYSGKLVRMLEGGVKAAAALGEAQVVAVIEGKNGRKDDIQIWSWRDGKSLMKMPMKSSFRCISARGGYLVAGDGQGRVHVWDASSGWLLKIFHAHYKAVTTVELSECGSLILTGGADAVVSCWLVTDILALGTSETAEPLYTFPELHSLPITCISLGLSGAPSLAVSGSLDGVLGVIKVANGERLGGTHIGSAIMSICIDSLERVAICGCRDGSVRKVSLQRSQNNSDSSSSSKYSVEEFKGHQKEVSGIALTFEESQIVSSSLDGKILIRDFDTMHILKTIESRNILHTLILKLDERTLHANVGPPPTSTHTTGLMGLKRDYHPEHLLPPVVKSVPTIPANDSMQSIATMFKTIGENVRPSKKRRTLETKESVVNNEGKTEVDRDLMDMDFLPLDVKGNSDDTKETKEIKQELTHWKEASRELYKLCTSKILEKLQD
mmetsp:Transcript_696/g.945  ORF Transcript_696/g.945 Transcript_696/m.945 type:complete len:460 (+) Transcript_696:70-1449(+)